MTEVGVFDPLVANRHLRRTAASLATKQKKYTVHLSGDPLADDFRVFLTMIWRHLKLPDPTALQLSIAYLLQHSDDPRLVIMAFRGAAKSWITAAFVLWTLYRNPQAKVMVASGSSTRAVAFTNFCLALIWEVPELKHLQPRHGQRQSSKAFDVGPALPDQSYSLFAVGITGQIVGFRGDLIVGDDVETNTNSMTVDMRSKLADSVREFDAILKPGGRVIFLGTPQTEASIYNLLVERGYVIKIWPARYPSGKLERAYGNKLAGYIKHALLSPKMRGQSTEPSRFTDEDLAARELSWGRAGFALQFMLDTSLADADRYPLKLSSLIVMGLDIRKGPDGVAWGTGDRLARQDLPVIGWDGDRLYGPASVGATYSPWMGTRAFIDPSGKGADETVLAISSALHGYVFVHKVAGWMDGYAPETLKAIAQLLVHYRVQLVRIEEDFGQGMFAQLLIPVLKEAWDEANKGKPEGERMMTAVESERAQKVQKETRILEVMEPIVSSHRLVVDEGVFKDDYDQVRNREGTDMSDRYSLMHQFTRLTREKDCLTHDDRIEAVAGAVSMWQEVVGINPREAAERAAREAAEKAMAAYFEDEPGGGTSRVGKALRGFLRTGKR